MTAKKTTKTTAKAGAKTSRKTKSTSDKSVKTLIGTCEIGTAGTVVKPEVNAAISGMADMGHTARFRQSNPTPIMSEDGSTINYIPWGGDNRLPRHIAVATAALPYTAQAITWLRDMVMGLGPKLMYHSSVYDTQTGRMKEISFPYEHGGEYLRSRIALCENDEERDRLKDDLRKWEDSYLGEPDPNNPSLRRYGIKTFLEENDIADLMQRWSTDQTLYDMCFPIIGLSADKHWANGYKDEVLSWRPRITRLGHIPAVAARMEEMDDRLDIRHVLYAEKWRGDATAELELKDVVAYPTLFSKNFLTKLRAICREQEFVEPKQRTYWYAAPLIMTDAANPYYPQPAWWSVFESKLYENVITLFADRATARQNATMWGKAIYINSEYLRTIFADRGISDSPEEQQAIREEIYDNINKFLRRRENNGKTICLDTFLSPDGRGMEKSVTIEDVATNKTADIDLTKDLAPLCSSIFFAMGVHPALIGAVPGDMKSSSGTYQRELTLLKQNQLSPRQRQFLRLLQNIAVFNEWDTHAQWVIRQQVLTTLDRNPEGTEEVEREQ